MLGLSLIWKPIAGEVGLTVACALPAVSLMSNSEWGGVQLKGALAGGHVCWVEGHV